MDACLPHSAAQAHARAAPALLARWRRRLTTPPPLGVPRPPAGTDGLGLAGAASFMSLEELKQMEVGKEA